MDYSGGPIIMTLTLRNRRGKQKSCRDATREEKAAEIQCDRLDPLLLALIMEQVGHGPRDPAASRILVWPSDDNQQ